MTGGDSQREVAKYSRAIGIPKVDAGILTVSLLLARRTQPLAAAASNARSHTVGMAVDSVANHATGGGVYLWWNLGVDTFA
ncbi:MAG TPA: hypothetical protein VJV79_34770 [Polyangiaceae bacterium]|nr:hypothetical protein [Polyangiaceae bacterium]